VKREGQTVPVEQRPEDSATLFLIDFEAVEDGNRLQLKSRSRKFAMSTLFDSHMAQNWFFRQADTGWTGFFSFIFPLYKKHLLNGINSFYLSNTLFLFSNFP
jgi:hypothetical protein